MRLAESGGSGAVKLSRPGASLWTSGGQPVDLVAAQLTHVCVGAHPDDVEILAFHGIAACHARVDRAFGAIVCTDGRGSPRVGSFAELGDDRVRRVRRAEQKAAARLGGYALLAMLDHDSRVAKEAAKRRVLVDELTGLLSLMRPEVLYTHNPADRHATHVGVASAVVAAVRRLPPVVRPRAFYGCEVWRDLDWLAEEDRVALDASAEPRLAEVLLKVFASQVEGGKRYDLATLGRRRAQATFGATHRADAAELVTLAVDLSPLVADPSLSLADFVARRIDAFRADALELVRSVESPARPGRRRGSPPGRGVGASRGARPGGAAGRRGGSGSRGGR